MKATFSAYLLTLFILILIIPGCNEDYPTISLAGNFSVGKLQSYDISGSQRIVIQDERLGVEFVFPNGGTGKLKVGELSSAPKMEFEGKKFYLEYSGSDYVEIHIPIKDTNDIITLHSYRNLYGETDNNPKNIAWWPVSEYIKRNDTLIYTVYSKKTNIKSNGITAYTPPAANLFTITTFAPGSTAAQFINAVRATILEIIDVWLDNLPAADAARARTNIRSTMTYTISLSTDGSAYVGNNSILWANANFYFQRNRSNSIELRSVAHEVGHYMSHVILGWERYNELQTLFRTGRDHEPGLIAANLGPPRLLGTLDDYAYISEFLITGAVDSYDYSNVKGSNNFADVTNNASPQSCDYPAHEAFPTALWITLMRSANSIYTFDSKRKANEKANVPVINASIQDVLALVVRGPRNVEEVRTHIQDYLDGLGNEQKFKLPAMVEPLGWSYNGNGVVVDGNNKPLKDVTVQNIYQDGTSEYGYRTFESPRTGSDGVFYLQRLYPGESILRFYFNNRKDSVDFPLSINWSKPTNQKIDLGTFKIGQGNTNVLENIKKCNAVYMFFDAKIQWNSGNNWEHINGYEGIKIGNFYGNYKGTITWSGNRLTYTYSKTWPDGAVEDESIILDFNNDGMITHGEGWCKMVSANINYERKIAIKNVPYGAYNENPISVNYDYQNIYSNPSITQYIESLSAYLKEEGNLKTYIPESVGFIVTIQKF